MSRRVSEKRFAQMRFGTGLCCARRTEWAIWILKGATREFEYDILRRDICTFCKVEKLCYYRATSRMFVSDVTGVREKDIDYWKKRIQTDLIEKFPPDEYDDNGRRLKMFIGEASTFWAKDTSIIYREIIKRHNEVREELPTELRIDKPSFELKKKRTPVIS